MAIDRLEREELSNKTEIEKLLDEIKNSAIGFENYKQFFDKIKNSDQVIMTQIENLVREYREYKTKFITGFEKDSHKQLMDDGFVKIEVFEDSRMMNKILLEAYNWKTLQEELYNIIFKKIYTILDDARALDIKRDALKEMREMEEKRQAMFIEIMNNMSNMFRDSVFSKMQSFDEKFLNLVMMMDEDSKRERKDIFDTLRKIVNDINVIEVHKREVITKSIQKEDVQTKRERLFNLEEEKRKVEAEKERRRQEQERQQRQHQQLQQPQRPQIKPTVIMDDIDNEFDSMDDDIEGEEINDEGPYDKF